VPEGSRVEEPATTPPDTTSTRACTPGRVPDHAKTEYLSALLWQAEFWHPCRGAAICLPVSGGLRGAPTTGYLLATLRLPMNSRPANRRISSARSIATAAQNRSAPTPAAALIVSPEPSFHDPHPKSPRLKLPTAKAPTPPTPKRSTARIRTSPLRTAPPPASRPPTVVLPRPRLAAGYVVASQLLLDVSGWSYVAFGPGSVAAGCWCSAIPSGSGASNWASGPGSLSLCW